jgi:hypothetical protein
MLRSATFFRAEHFQFDCHGRVVRLQLLVSANGCFSECTGPLWGIRVYGVADSAATSASDCAPSSWH